MQAPLDLLVLPELSLIAFDFHPAVSTAGRRHCIDPIGSALTHQICSQ